MNFLKISDSFPLLENPEESRSKTLGSLQNSGISPKRWESSKTLGSLQNSGIPPKLWDLSKTLGIL